MPWGDVFSGFADGFTKGFHLAQEAEERKAKAGVLEKEEKLLDLQIEQAGPKFEMEKAESAARRRASGASASLYEAQAAAFPEAHKAELAQRAASTAADQARTAHTLAETAALPGVTRANIEQSEAARDLNRATAEETKMRALKTYQEVEENNNVINIIRMGKGLKPREIPPPDFGEESAVPAGDQQSSLSDEDRDLMIRMTAMEAGGESEQGKQAVANVMFNRLRSGRFGRTMRDVLTAPYQFEPWKTKRNELMALDPNSPAYKNAEYAVMQAEAEDITGGATHFLNPDIVRRRREAAGKGASLPDWAVNEQLTIGGHTFFAPEGAVADGSVGATRYAPTAALDTGETMSDAPPITGAPSVHDIVRVGMEGLYAAGDTSNQGIAEKERMDLQLAAVGMGHKTDAAPPEKIKEVADAIQAAIPEQEMSQGELMLETINAVYLKALAKGDGAGAREAVQAALITYKQQAASFLALAQAAAEDKNLDNTMKALASAHAFIPDGLDLDLKKDDKGIIARMIDPTTGNVVREQRLENPDQLFEQTLKATPAVFESLIIDAAKLRDQQRDTFGPEAKAFGESVAAGKPDLALAEGLPGEQFRMAMQLGPKGGQGGRTKITDLRTAREMADSQLEAPLTALTEGGQIDSGDANLLITAAADLIMDGVDEGLAAAIVQSATSVDTSKPDASPFVEQEDGTVIFQHPSGLTIPLPPTAEAILRDIRDKQLNAAMAAEKEAQKPGIWERMQNAITPPSALPIQ